MLPLNRPFRLLMTVDSVGGIWRYALDLCAEFAQRGVSVTLTGFGPPPSAGQRREADAAGVDLVWLDAPLDWTGESNGGLQRGAAALDSLLRERSPDLLHLNTPPLAALLEQRPPCVAAAHSCLATWWRAMRAAPLPPECQSHADDMAAGLAAADVVTAPTAAFAAQLRACYGPLPALRVVTNGGRAIAPGPKQPLVLSAGRWWDEAKNLEALEAAAPGIVWPVYVAGALNGPGSAAPAPANVRSLGSLDHRDLAAWFSKAPVFVSAARYEPFGLAVLEAANAGAALVLSDIPTFRELWGECALFVDPERPEEIAQGVNLLVRDADLRERLARRAQERAAAFTVARQADALADAYAAAAALQTV